MRFDLAAMFRRQRNPRRTVVPLRPIVAPAMHATSLYQAAYRDVVNVWTAALPAIVAEYERTLAQMHTDSPADVAARISAVQTHNAAVFLTVRAKLERWAQMFARWHTRKWRANVLAATGVDLGTMLGADDTRMTVEAAIERNVALVSSVNDQARQRIADSVYRGLNERKPATEVAADFRDAVDMGRSRALNIAADQTVKLASALNDERRMQAGIDTWEWMHSAKRHPREWHLVRNGKLYSENGERVGTNYEGKTIAAPPAANDLPGRPPFCGCTSRAVLILD